jgi:predicted amidohydrolase
MSDARTPLRAACVQLNAARPLDDVLATAEALVGRAAAAGAELVVLPEKWNAIGPKERMLEAAEDLSGPTVTAMQSWARQHGIWLVGGSISERLDGEPRIRNLSLAFDPAGGLLAAYRKLHMFDVEVDGRAVRESATDRPGDELIVATWPAGRSG